MATLLPDARAAYAGWVPSAQHDEHPDESSPPHTLAGSTSTPIAGTTLLISLVVIGGVMLIAACAALVSAIVQRRRRSAQPPVPMPEAPTTGTMIMRTNTGGDYGSSYASNGSWYTPFWQQTHSSSSGPQQGVPPAAGMPVDGGAPVVGIPVMEPGMVGQVQDAHVAAARQASLESWAVERRLREWAWLQTEQQSH